MSLVYQTFGGHRPSARRQKQQDQQSMAARLKRAKPAGRFGILNGRITGPATEQSDKRGVAPIAPSPTIPAAPEPIDAESASSAGEQS